MRGRAPLRRAAAAIAFLSLGLVTSAFAGGEVPVTACGQTVASGDRGYLTGDLDCTGDPGGFYGGAIVLQRGARLDLRGFTLTADPAGTGVVCGESCGDDQPYSICKGSCKLTGSGGVITGASVGVIGGSLDVRDVTITGCTTAIGPLRRLILRDSTLTANTAWGILGSCKPKIIDSTITASGTGVNTGFGVVLKGSSVTGNVHGDLVTSRLPKLIDSTCETSKGAENGTASWGVCTLD